MATKLLDSFGAVYAALDRPRIARRAVVGLLVIHTCLLAYSAYVHSPTLNEPGHLVAGLSNWKFGRFDIYSVNPPLVRMVAALPVMAAGYKEDWSGFYEGPGARPEFGMGEFFVKVNGERSFLLFMIARWACIPFSWIGAIVCYLWARDLYGQPSGVMACAIWCFEPNILAHASLITPDAHATALGLAACYTFWRWLKRPTWTQVALTGVVLGLAELAKTTLILFYPLWPLMWLIYRWPDRREIVAHDWLREAGMLAVRMLIGLYVLNLGYAFEGSFQKLKQYQFVSDLFTRTQSDSSRLKEGSGEVSVDNTKYEIRNTKSVNRFAGTWVGDLPLPFPTNYLLGIDLQQKDFEHYSRPSYLRGVWQDHGWWYYYLYACAIKVPLGLWALGIFAFVVRMSTSLREKLGEGQTRIPSPERGGLGRGPNCPTLSSREGRGEGLLRDEFVLLFPALVIFTVVSSKTGFSEHMRYVLPAFPYFFIAISQIARQWRLTPVNGEVRSILIEPNRRFRFVRLLLTTLISILGCWTISSSLWVYPHILSYFNESIGGPCNGANHLLGSNVDWNQDLLYLKSQLDTVRGMEQSIRVAELNNPTASHRILFGTSQNCSDNEATIESTGCAIRVDQKELVKYAIVSVRVLYDRHLMNSRYGETPGGKGDVCGELFRPASYSYRVYCIKREFNF